METTIFAVAGIGKTEPKIVELNSLFLKRSDAEKQKETLLKEDMYSDVRITPNTISY